MSSGQASYYLELAREDYYLQGGEPPGKWYGEGATALGLCGEVESDQLYNLFDGLTPDGSCSLVQKQRHSGKALHRPGWDLTFSAPKSLSVLWSQASPQHREALQYAHEQAVRAALDYLQETAAITRRGRGGNEFEHTGLVVACFEHSVSRAEDPQLHTHALVMNLGVRYDGTTGTLSSLSLFQSKMVAGALYRVELSARLEQDFGIPVERRGPWFEISGVPKGLVQEFSKRREAIEQELRRKGKNSPEAAAVTALETREVKQGTSRDHLFKSWAEAGERHGWSLQSADRLFDSFHHTRDRREECAQAIARAITKIEGEVAHFTQRDFLRCVAEEAQCRGLGAESVRRAGTECLRSSPEIVRLGCYFGEARYTTTETLRLEESLIATAKALSEDERHTVAVQPVMLEIANRADLSEEQIRALWHLTHETGSLAIVSGLAGTGKTKMLDAARSVWEAQGFQVIGATLSARAASELQAGAAITSCTIAKLLYDQERGKNLLDSKSVLVVDEAGMVSTPQMDRLARFAAETGAKLVLVGDERQLQAIGQGGCFKELGRRHGRAELFDIRRQTDSWARKAVRELSDGKAREALHAFASRGLVNVSETKSEAMEELVRQWRQDRIPMKESLILAGTRSEVRSLNRLAQEARAGSKELTGPSVEVGGSRFFNGDRVMFTKNHRPLGIMNGSRGTLVQIGEARMSVQLDSGERVSFDPNRMSDVALAYAATTHKAQGATATRTYVLAGGSMQDREISYVQASRAREQTTFFATRAEVGDSIAALAREMERTRQKEMAHTVLRVQEAQEHRRHQ